MDYNYLAGFIDGEGSIILKPPRVRLYISNTDKNILLKIKEFLKCGTVYSVKRRKNKNWSDQYGWTIANHRDCLRILKELEDKLIIKKEKCQEAIEYIENKRWFNEYLSKEELKKLIICGHTQKEMAEMLKVSRFSISKYLKKHGLR